MYMRIILNLSILHSLSLGALPVLGVDDELVELDLVGAPLVEGELQARLIEVSRGGGGLDGELLPGAPAQGDQGPGLLLVPRPAISARLLQISCLAADVHIIGV